MSIEESFQFIAGRNFEDRGRTSQDPESEDAKFHLTISGRLYAAGRFPTGTVYLVKQISDSETLVAGPAFYIWLTADQTALNAKVAQRCLHVVSVNDEVTPILGGKSSSYASCSEIGTRKYLQVPL